MQKIILREVRQIVDVQWMASLFYVWEILASNLSGRVANLINSFDYFARDSRTKIHRRDISYVPLRQ